MDASNKFDKSILSFKLLENENFEKLDKAILVKLIYCYNEICKESLIKSIADRFNSKTDLFEKELNIIKINSILSELNNKKYSKKIIYDSFSFYFYFSEINIYFKTLSAELFDQLLLLEFSQLFIVRRIKNKVCKEEIDFSNREKGVEELKSKLVFFPNNVAYLNLKINVNQLK